MQLVVFRDRQLYQGQEQPSAAHGEIVRSRFLGGRVYCTP